MCGRFTQSADAEQLRMSFPFSDIPETITPRYNIAPSQPVAVIPNVGSFKLDYFNWGMVPSWSKDPAIGSRMINARAETLQEKPSYKKPFQYKRCLIPATGFYEWKTTSSGKEPYYFKLENDQLFALAGLWDLWQSKDGSQIYSFTIITTEPNQLVSQVHNRMPVILPPDYYLPWLDAQNHDLNALQGFLKPYSAKAMTSLRVSRLVNSPANDGPECVVEAT